MIYLFHELKICSVTMFTVNSLLFDGIQMQFSLYATLHTQICGILTVITYESARVSDFSPHGIFAVK